MEWLLTVFGLSDSASVNEEARIVDVSQDSIALDDSLPRRDKIEDGKRRNDKNDEEAGREDSTTSSVATKQPKLQRRSVKKSNSGVTLNDHDDNLATPQASALIHVFVCFFLPIAIFMIILFVITHKGKLFVGKDNESHS